MSGQGPSSAHKVRRNVSPSQRQGPMKAVLPFGIIKNSPSRSPSSPVHSVWQRRSPVHDSRRSPDQRSPNSPIFKVERQKPVRISPASSSLRRTSSLDTIGPYLKGQWPADLGTNHHVQPQGSCMLDKTTQTPENWHIDVISDKTEKKKKKHRRSASFGHADKKLPLSGNSSISSIRRKLQKTKDQGLIQRHSPIQGNHNALLQTAPAILMHSVAISIPRAPHKPAMSRYQRNSVEGLSQEIEKLSLTNYCGADEDYERPLDIPEGHRAPVPDISTPRTPSCSSGAGGMRSIDTQTPSGILDRSSASPAGSPASRPPSISPAISGYTGIPGHLDLSPRPSSNYDSSGSTPRDKDTGGSESVSPDSCLKKTASPKPNKIVREPPDGCEKVKVFDEDKTGKPQPSIKEPLGICRLAMSPFELKPSNRSAFCALKTIYTQGATTFKPQTSPITTTTTNTVIIEGQQL